MELWYHLIGAEAGSRAHTAAALAGAQPLPGGALPGAGDLLLVPGSDASIGSDTLLQLLQAHHQRRSALTLAVPEGQEPIGLEGGPVPPEPALAAVDLGRLGSETARFLDSPGALAEWARGLGHPVVIWRWDGGTAVPSRQAWLAELAAAGVIIADPATTWVDTHAEIARGTVILPLTMIEGHSVIGPGCRIGPGSHVRESHIGQGCRVWFSVIEESDLGRGVEVGPYAHLRPGCTLEAGVRVGNFVELKNAHVGADARLPHHSYMGEVDIGAAANIGAGAVVVNFDGRSKRRAKIGDGAMVGCNSNVIAPAAIGENGYVAAGSTITEDVPSGALAVGRGRQQNVDGWVERRLGPGRASGIGVTRGVPPPPDGG
jgi:acyl-[acyl carrier protein]--UDP-N-acetylglucosamine O-acyltransferase